jgi:O-antigen/teichoic acid export membrane protein
MLAKLIKLNKLFATATFRQSMLTTIAVGINGVLGVCFFVLVARFLGPVEFGIFSIAIATISMVADIADFGTNTGIVRFIPKYLNQKTTDAYKLLKLSLEIKAVVWFIVLIVGISAASLIADIIFKKPELTLPLQLSFIGVGGAMLFSFTQASLQAYQKYKIWSFVNIFSNSLRLIIFLLIALAGFGQLPASLFIYLGLPFCGFLLGLWFLPIKNIIRAKNEIEMLKDFRSFSWSVGIFTVIAAISGRLDTYIGARLLSPQELGVYGAAVQLNSFILQIIGAIGVVVAPKFASFDTLDKMIAYLKKFQILVVLLALIILIGSPLVFIIFPLFYGNGYEMLPRIFLIYLVGMLIYLISVPVHTVIFYYFSKPQVFIYLAIGHLFLILGLATILTQYFGIIGLTIAVVVGMVFNLLVPLFYVLNRINKGKLNG